jgi:hypothetical protein
MSREVGPPMNVLVRIKSTKKTMVRNPDHYEEEQQCYSEMGKLESSR